VTVVTGSFFPLLTLPVTRQRAVSYSVEVTQQVFAKTYFFPRWRERRMPSAFFCFLLLFLPFVPTVLRAQNSFPTESASSLEWSSAPCAIETVLPQVASRVEEFVDNENRFTAKEVIDRERFDHNGNVRGKMRTHANYVIVVQRMKAGWFSVDEYRNEVHGMESPPEYLEANITSTLSLIFHPTHLEEFNMSCEGPSEWHGHRSWRIRFEQRQDRQATMSVLQVGSHYYTLLLKGLALIDSENYQILHLETDLLKPVPAIKLVALHQSVEYQPVTFFKNDSTMYLPWQAFVLADFKGKRLLERHSYSDFRLFAVDTEQKIGKPTAKRATR
jgi:hypothetical protein